MATSSVTSYKNARSARVTTPQTTFQAGCYYTNQEVPAGFAKLLVNFDYSDDGRVLKPRMGVTNDAILEYSTLDSRATEQIDLGDAHVDGLLYFKDLANYESLTETIVSFGRPYYYGASGTTSGGKPVNIPQGYYFNPNIFHKDGSVFRVGETGWSIVLDKRNLNRYITQPYSIGHFKKGITTDTSVGLIKTKVYNNIDLFNTGLNTFQVERPIYTLYNGYIYTICTSYLEHQDGVIRCEDPVFRLSRIRLEEQAGDTSTFNPTRDPVIIKKPTVSEATTTGYNMLLPEPYEFPNVAGATRVHGIIAYRPSETGASDPFGEVLFSANRGELIRFNCVYSFETGASYKIKWEYKGATAENWSTLKDFTAFTAGVSSYAYYDLTPSDMVFSLRVTIRKGDDVNTDQIGILSRFELELNDLKNVSNEVFDLNTATGMFSYNNMLGLYGVKGAETTLFFSDIDNPGYFPFPHNMEHFDEQVLKVINYLDMLIVVTTNSVYSITGAGLPSNFVTKKIITNLNITELDAELIKVIKDQIFFKADNTFFVLKPNTYTGEATDLRNYEVSKAINIFLQNFKINTLELFNKLYPLRLTEPSLSEDNDTLNTYKYNAVKIVGYNQHVVDGKLQIVLRLELTCDNTPNEVTQRVFVNMVDLTLVYDTLNKQWYLHTHNLLNTGAIRHRRIDNQALLMFDNITRETIKYLVVAKFSNTPKDYYYTEDLSGNIFEQTPKLPNWQLLSTGIMTMNNLLYKRLRELQFTIDNIDQDHLYFYTTVYADGRNVRDTARYVLEHVTNPDDIDYGHVFVNRYDEPNIEINSTTMLDSWELDFSKFPDVNFLRVHLELKGKGRFISSEFINRDEKRYELSNTVWVYRIMNGR